MKKLTDGQKILIWIGICLVISVLVFTINKDGGASGWAILMNQTGGEWVRMIFCSLMVGVVAYAMLRYYNKNQDMPGNTVKAFVAAIMIFMGIAFGKACTDKTNGGVTGGNGRPGGAAQVDSTRIPAEDLIPKK